MNLKEIFVYSIYLGVGEVTPGGGRLALPNLLEWLQGGNVPCAHGYLLLSQGKAVIVGINGCEVAESVQDSITSIKKGRKRRAR